MKKSVILILVFLSFLFYQALAYSAISLKHELNSIERDIKNNQRKINSLKHSSYLSEYEKQRKIKKLERENYYKRSKIKKIKRDYARVIS